MQHVPPPALAAPMLTSGRRRFGRRSLLGGAALAGGLIAASVSRRPRPTRAQTVAVTPAPPVTAAATVFAIDIDANTPLYAANPDERRPTGSTVKIMTALVTIDNLELGEQITIVESDQVDTAIYSHMGIVAGDLLSVEQLLYGLLLPSGSDVAKALARVVGAKLTGLAPTDAAPAREAFIAAMNERAATMGLANSFFTNASGDDDADQYSSARDLATMAGALLNSPTLATVVRTPTWQGYSLGPEQRFFDLRNSNAMLTEDPSTIGVKTGSTPEAGTCLVEARQMGERNRVVSVVLGCPGTYDANGFLIEDGRWEAIRTIITALAVDYAWLPLTVPDTLPGLTEELAVWQAAIDPLITQPAPAGARLSYRLVLGPEAAPGSEVGQLRVYHDATVIGERPVFQAGGV